MSRWLRVALLYLEGLGSIIAGVTAVFAPEMMIDKIIRIPGNEAAFAVSQQLGTAWIVLGLFAIMLTVSRDPKSLRWFALPLMVGDLFQVFSVWPWDAFALGHVIPSVIYFVNRGSIALWPESFIRPKS